MEWFDPDYPIPAMDPDYDTGGYDIMLSFISGGTRTER
jgi:hypothetical protein